MSAEDAVRAVAEAGGYIAERRGDTFQIVERKDAGLDGLSGNSVLRTFKVSIPTPRPWPTSSPSTSRATAADHPAARAQPDRRREDQPTLRGAHCRAARAGGPATAPDPHPAKILEVRLDRNEAFGVDWSKIVGGSNRTFTGGTQGLADRASSGLFSVVSGKPEHLPERPGQQGPRDYAIDAQAAGP